MHIAVRGSVHSAVPCSSAALQLSRLRSDAGRDTSVRFVFCAPSKRCLRFSLGYHTFPGTLERVRPYLPEFLGLFVLLTISSYRFTGRLPRSRFDTITLVGGVLGLAFDVNLEPNLWPLRASAILLAASWGIDRFEMRPQSRPSRHSAHESKLGS